MNKTFVGRLNAWLAAARVYDPAPPPGWELDINFGTSGVLATGTGFFAYALKPLSTNNTVDPTSRLLVFRGTELSDLRDIYADASDVGRDQFLSAQEKINSYTGNRGATAC